MTDYCPEHCTAFAGMRKIARGSLTDVALAVKAASDAVAGEMVLVFDDADGRVIDLDLRGSVEEILARLGGRAGQTAPASPPVHAISKGRGRPKLGVVPREVTLLPRHWEWLSAQPGGASQALRRLVDHARQADEGRTGTKLARERAYRFMSALAGDLPGFEEAARALFRGDAAKLARETGEWPEDVREHALTLAASGQEE